MMPNQMAPEATPAPIHDIADPFWLLSFSTWTIVAAGIALLAALALVTWLMRRRRSVRALTPKERALVVLNNLRKEEGEVEPYAFGIQVSDALRGYIRDQYGLDAVRRTSVEFLESLRDNMVFSANEKAALAEFLESVDLLKYARHQAASEEIRVLLEIAERLVEGEREQEAAPKVS